MIYDVQVLPSATQTLTIAPNVLLLNGLKKIGQLEGSLRRLCFQRSTINQPILSFLQLPE
jgi:hypothetical protein